MSVTKNNNSTCKNQLKSKPAKPYKDFPLFPHANKQWAKKIRGRLYYFGTWDDPMGALDNYLAQKDYLFSGTTPPDDTSHLTLRELCNKYLTSQEHRLSLGEISKRHFQDMYNACKVFLDTLGRHTPVNMLQPDQWAKLRHKMSRGKSAITVKNQMTKIKGIFNWAEKNYLLDRPKYGSEFEPPTAAALRRERYEYSKEFSREEITMLLDEASPQLKAMILLAINTGCGNSDISDMNHSDINLNSNWLDYQRHKTGIIRRANLWPETLNALKEAMRSRPEAKAPDDEQAVFITKQGHRWVRFEVTLDKGGRNIDSIGLMFGRLMRELEIKKPRRGFYGLRHTFQTVAENTGDFPAIDMIMGHELPGGNLSEMSRNYRQSISDKRLKAVTDYIHNWLYGKLKGTK